MERWDSDVEEDFCDPDYNISDEDDDFQEVIAKENNRKGKGRPRNVASTLGPSSKTLIIVPQQNTDVDSDYADSDELLEEVDSEKENDKVTYEEYNETKHRDRPTLALGMKFGGFEEFKQACRDWSIKHRRQLYFSTSDKYTAKRYLDNFRTDPDWSAKGLIAAVLKDCSYTISYKKARRVKKIALKWVHGEEDLQHS
ncbi:hypothetical protein P3L10_009262 [Capsicum annuum]